MDGVGVVITESIAVVIAVLGSKVREEVPAVGVRVNGGCTAIHAVVIAKAIAIGVKGLLPVGIELVAINIAKQVIRPAVLVSVFATIAVNPRRTTFVVATIDFISESVRVVVCATLNHVRRKPCIGWACVWQWAEWVIAKGVAVAVFPLVAHRRHGVDEVKHQVTVLVRIQSQHDDIVIHRVPVRHVDRPVTVERGMDGLVGGDVPKHDRHPGGCTV